MRYEYQIEDDKDFIEAGEKEQIGDVAKRAVMTWAGKKPYWDYHGKIFDVKIKSESSGKTYIARVSVDASTWKSIEEVTPALDYEKEANELSMWRTETVTDTSPIPGYVFGTKIEIEHERGEQSASVLMSLRKVYAFDAIVVKVVGIDLTKPGYLERLKAEYYRFVADEIEKKAK